MDVLNEKDFWNLLQPDDVEDLLCMWLYKEKNYVVIPSTNKRRTKLYKCVLIDPNAEEYRPIYIQAKKGAVTIDASEYSKLNGEVYFLTTEGAVLNADKDNYHVVNPRDVYRLAIDPAHIQLIPEWITNRIKSLTLPETES